MLLLLTTLFGSSFGNDLLKTFIFVLVFGALVFGLRILSIWVWKHLQETTNLSIIDCDTTDEMWDVRSKLCTMQHIFVRDTNKFLHANGKMVRNPMYIGLKGHRT